MIQGGHTYRESYAESHSLEKDVGKSRRADFQVDCHCSSHKSQRAHTICVHPLCNKTFCYSCQAGHSSLGHQSATYSLSDFGKRASKQLEDVISVLKRERQDLEKKIRENKEVIKRFVERVFCQVEKQATMSIQKALCQLETRYIRIRKGESSGYADHVAKGISYIIPKLEIDNNTICLETVLQRMVHLKKEQKTIGIVTDATASHISGFTSGVNTILTAPTVTNTISSKYPDIVITPAGRDDIFSRDKAVESTFKDTFTKIQERRNTSLPRDFSSSTISKNDGYLYATESKKTSPLQTSRAQIKAFNQRMTEDNRPFEQLLRINTEPELSRVFKDPLNTTMESVASKPETVRINTSPTSLASIPSATHIGGNSFKNAAQKIFSNWQIEEMIKKNSKGVSRNESFDKPAQDTTKDYNISRPSFEKQNTTNNRFILFSPPKKVSWETCRDFMKDGQTIINNLKDTCSDFMKEAQDRRATLNDIPFPDSNIVVNVFKDELPGDYKKTYEFKYYKNVSQ